MPRGTCEIQLRSFELKCFRHSVCKAPAETLQQAGVVLGDNYPHRTITADMKVGCNGGDRRNTQFSKPGMLHTASHAPVHAHVLPQTSLGILHPFVCKLALRVLDACTLE